jgi:AAA15 family ATPase/GTPase
MLNLQNLDDAKNKLSNYDPTTFDNVANSFVNFITKIQVDDFRSIKNLSISFEHPITIITGTNKIGKTSILLLLSCSHYNFMRYDSTKPETILRRHTWKDVMPFTSHENASNEYSYKLNWRVGKSNREGIAKRNPATQAWTGIGKASADLTRVNAQIRDRQVRFLDLERISPARNTSVSLMRKIGTNQAQRVNADVETAFSYIFDQPNTEISSIGSHINKTAYLISSQGSAYSSYNAASGEESLINILIEVFSVPNGSLIIIDELEVGFHPSVQRKLADVLSYISWTHKKQFVITTHSPALLASFPQKSRKYIDKKADGTYETINRISVNATFSKMDSQAHPLVQLYCEDDIAEFIIRSILMEMNQANRNFDRLINIIKSGPIDQVKNDYIRHKRNYSQYRLKIGFACVFDGDHKDHHAYSSYHENPSEFSFFLYPYTAPEKFLVKAFVQQNNNAALDTALNYSDHHSLFSKMVELGLAADERQALNECWVAFKITSEYQKLALDMKEFLVKTTRYFSETNE